MSRTKSCGIVLLLACSALIPASLAAGCSTSSNPGGGSATFDGGNLDATFGEDATADAGDAAATSLAACLSGAASGPVPSSCAPLVQCLESTCGTQLTACFGAGYASGAITGECASFETCATQHACTSAAGVSCAGQTTSACQQCVQGLASCASTSCAQSLSACEGSLLSGLVDAGAQTDASPTGDSSMTASDAAPDAPVDAAVVECGDAGPCTGGFVCDVIGQCVDIYPEWPMPNDPGADDGGAPNLESYTDNGDGTVTDDVTGLMWEQTGGPGIDGGAIAGLYSIPQAFAYCSGLTLAGHSDWRLPSLLEGTTILDTEQSQPSINGTYFPGTNADNYWTSTPVATQAGWSYTNWLSFGAVSDDNTGSFVRCVRSTSAIPTGSRYTTGTLGSVPTVHDNRTGLTWQQYTSASAGATQYTQAAATTACVALGSGWRLPTYKELVTLVDYAQTGATGPMIDAVFTDTPSGETWTSTPFVVTPPYQMWMVSFAYGSTGYNTTNAPYYARCVQ
jgi:hypothetical protein